MKNLSIVEQIVRVSIFGALLLSACSAGVLLSSTSVPDATPVLPQVSSSPQPVQPQAVPSAAQENPAAPAKPAASHTGIPADSKGIGTLAVPGSGPVSGEAFPPREMTEEPSADLMGGGLNMPFVIQWHQEGGIAGVCQDVFVFSDGNAFAISCKGGQQVNLGKTRLSEEQLTQVKNWASQYKSFKYERSNPGVPDAMTVRLVFSGSGIQDAPETVYTDMQRLSYNALQAIRK
jgi:hypothetical protein